MRIETIKTDVLIIGGGTAGCYAALTIAEASPDTNIVIAEKANIRRSGCLAAGVNALNAYITKGHTPDFYVDYAVKDAHGIAREDLLLSMSEHLNEVTARLEQLGLVILKDENGEYVSRGNRNIKINGENIKPILADAVEQLANVTVINNLNIVDYIVQDGRVVGAYGNGVLEEQLTFIRARTVLIATGGAAGLYKPNHPGFSRHKMWYCPFDTGAGYAMGIRAGAEMTTFEMRFIALRCKDTIAPTGTLAQGVGARQVNSLGEIYEDKYGLTTSQRVWGTVAENEAGRGPCYLRTVGIDDKQAEDLEKAYLNMAPSQTLKWVAAGKNAKDANVEIEGTEPYVVGGHTASGYWIDNKRRTTLPGLFAAGDVAGGCPQKYVTGALAEGKIAALAMLEYLQEEPGAGSKAMGSTTVARPQADCANAASQNSNAPAAANAANDPESTFTSDVQRLLSNQTGPTPEELEERMQDIMDRYAGGISTHYAFTEESLDKADALITQLTADSAEASCKDMQDLTHYYEVRERLVICRTLIAHLRARKETRWHCFAENRSYPQQDDAQYLKYVNSRLVDGQIQIILRDLAPRRGPYDYDSRTGHDSSARCLRPQGHSPEGRRTDAIAAGDSARRSSQIGAPPEKAQKCIRINTNACVGCGRCIKVCPGTLLTIGKDHKAEIRYPKDCWGCVSCVKECRAGAIEFYLAEDMGGNDTWMKVRQDGHYLIWEFYRGTDKIRTISVDRASSNQY